MNNTAEHDFFGFPKVKVRWTNLYSAHVKFSQDLTYLVPKIIKIGYTKYKKVDVFLGWCR